MRDTVYQILAHTYESASPLFYQASDMPGITVSKREQYKKASITALTLARMFNNGLNPDTTPPSLWFRHPLQNRVSRVRAFVPPPELTEPLTIAVKGSVFVLFCRRKPCFHGSGGILSGRFCSGFRLDVFILPSATASIKHHEHQILAFHSSNSFVLKQP